ncbi:MAG: hypothetical protein IJA34_00535 [Lachnospiraceae bacterium]|nr:hypothetical protein [Lachnospiraceae bacterium]
MDKNYVEFIIAYDFGHVFSTMALACDEAYELAQEIYLMYKKYLEETNGEDCYETLHSFCSELDFNFVKARIERKYKEAQLKAIILDDIKTYHNLNSNKMIKDYLEIEECSDTDESGLYNLIFNDNVLWFGTLGEINVIVKTMVKRIEIEGKNNES